MTVGVGLFYVLLGTAYYLLPKACTDARTRSRGSCQYLRAVAVG